jgi:hypothetical protein
MKKYPRPVPRNHFELNDAALAADLDFSVEPDFISLPPQIDPQIMLKRIEENMPWRNSRPGEAERRLAEKIPVEFVF